MREYIDIRDGYVFRTIVIPDFMALFISPLIIVHNIARGR